jgi:peptidoglycan hydrolase CwlO-like protein
MKKTIPALIAAVLVTVVLGTGMFLIGQNALGISTAKAAATTNTVSTGTVAQYEQLVAQYQTRETQYQAQIAQATNQINTANQQLTADSQQIQQYQSLLSQLQNNGLITVANDGTVTINQSPNQPGFLSFFSDHHDGDGH